MSALPLHRRAWLYIRAANLLWNISAGQDYLEALSRDGIADTATQRAWRDRMAAERVELAVIRAELDRHPLPMVAAVLLVLLGPATVGVFGPALWGLFNRWNGG